MYWCCELKNKFLTSRKPHICSWCNEKINKGERYYYRVYIFYDFITEHTHPECYEAMKTLGSESWEDGWDVGMFKRGTIEVK